MPYLGRLQYFNRIPRHTAVDWKIYNETGKKVPYDNSSTGGYLQKLSWLRTVRIRNMLGFYIYLYNSGKKRFIDRIKENPKLYKKYPTR